MFQTSARVSAALALEWDDVDLAAGEATIGRDKNGDPHVIHLTTEMVAILASLPKDRRRYSATRLVTPAMGRSRRRARRPGSPTSPPISRAATQFATELIVRHAVDAATTAKLGNWRSTRVLMDNYVHAEGEADVVQRVFGTPKSQAGSKQRKGKRK